MFAAIVSWNTPALDSITHPLAKEQQERRARIALRSGAVSNLNLTQHLRASKGFAALSRNRIGDIGKMDKDKQQNTGSFDPIKALTDIRTSRAIARRRRYTKSKLERYRAELVGLRNAGASLSDIAYWLRKEKRMKVQRTTIQRYLDKLTETRGGIDTELNHKSLQTEGK
jgi:hypothetical protein